MAPRSRYKQVTWKTDRPHVRADRPFPFVADAILEPEHAKLIENKLEPGELFLVRNGLMVRGSAGYIDPPHPYVSDTWYDPTIPVATLAIYAGMVRVEEQKGSGLFRTKRHSFIINGTRYLTTNMNLFMPADQTPRSDRP